MSIRRTGGKFFRTALLGVLGGALLQGYDIIRSSGQVVTWNPGAITMQIKMATSPTLIDGTNYAASVQMR